MSVTTESVRAGSVSRLDRILAAALHARRIAGETCRWFDWKRRAGGTGLPTHREAALHDREIAVLRQRRAVEMLKSISSATPSSLVS